MIFFRYYILNIRYYLYIYDTYILPIYITYTLPIYITYIWLFISILDLPFQPCLGFADRSFLCAGHLGNAVFDRAGARAGGVGLALQVVEAPLQRVHGLALAKGEIGSRNEQSIGNQSSCLSPPL